MLHHWSSVRRAIVLSELLWPSGIFCSRSETVELSAKTVVDISHNTTSFVHSLKTFFSQRTSA